MATISCMPGTLVFVFSAILLQSFLVEQISAEKYSDYLLPGETGKYITLTSGADEQLCHICHDNTSDCGRNPVNEDCRAQIAVSETEAVFPWCYCGQVVGCSPLPDYEHGAYECSPFGHSKGTVYQTCVPLCNAGFRLTQGNVLRCGEDRKWNYTLVQVICTPESTSIVPGEVTTKQTSTPSVQPSVNVSGVPTESGQGHQGEEETWVNSALVGSVAIVCFLVLVFLVSFLCYKYKRCSLPGRKSQSTSESLVLTVPTAVPVSSTVVPLDSQPESDNAGLSEEVPTPSSSTTVSVHSHVDSEVDHPESAPLLAQDETKLKEVAGAESTPSSIENDTKLKEVVGAERDADFLKSDPLLKKTSSIEDDTELKQVVKSAVHTVIGTAETTEVADKRQDVKDSESVSISREDPTISFPSPDTFTTENEIQQGSNKQKEVQQTDGPGPQSPAIEGIQHVKSLDENIPSLRPVDVEGYTNDDIGLLSAEPLTLSDFNEPLESRDEPDGADSMYVDVPRDETQHGGESVSDYVKRVRYTTLKSGQNHNYYGERTNVAEFSSPVVCPQEVCAAPVPALDGNRTDHRGEKEGEEYQADHPPVAAEDQQGEDIIADGECVTFSKFQNERDAVNLFFELDLHLVLDKDMSRNWYGVSHWILCRYNINDLALRLKSIPIIMRNPTEGNAYFKYVIDNFFMANGVKLGQVLYFYAKKYRDQQILQCFKKYHPRCRYCEKFYEKP